MKWIQNAIKSLSAVGRYRIRRIIIISIAWTLINIFLYFRNVSNGDDIDYPYHELGFAAILLRSFVVLIISFFMSWLLLREVKIVVRKRTIVINWIIKVLFLMLIALAASIIIFFLHFLIIKGIAFRVTFYQFVNYFLYTNFLTDILLFWFVMLLLAQTMVQIDQKYSPGVFWEIMTGKYLTPRNEKRIIMFLDLKDSTPIAEQLGHEKYFLFIKDFIHYISIAVLDNKGMIYQYVGDEVVVTWPYKKSNVLKSMQAVIESRKAMQRKLDYFRRTYGITPEFRAGLHIGNVTIGEIGVIKKDIAISGEAMNITARIRSACNELNQKYIVSSEYFDTDILKSWQGEDLGVVSLKGVDESMKLYALKI